MQFDKEKTKKALTNWYKDKGISPYDRDWETASKVSLNKLFYI